MHQMRFNALQKMTQNANLFPFDAKKFFLYEKKKKSLSVFRDNSFKKVIKKSFTSRKNSKEGKKSLTFKQKSCIIYL